MRTLSGNHLAPFAISSATTLSHRSDLASCNGVTPPFQARRKFRAECKEAPVGVEPTMADLQSAALATWLRRQATGNLGKSHRPVKWCGLCRA